jgi:gas vesicle protein
VKGVKIKSEAPEFPMLLYFLNTLFIGAAIAIIVVLLVTVQEQKELVQEMANQQQKLHDTIEWYRIQIETFEDSFHDAEARFTRIEHNMHISRGKRLAAVKSYDERFGEQ